MARPQKEGLDYFPHDTDAVNDEKIEALRALHGNDGYAFYFILLERIYRSPYMEIDISDAETIQILARKVSVTTEKFTEIMQTALKWRCFDPEKYRNHHILTSNGVKKRAMPVLEKRSKMRLLYTPQQVSTPISDAETTPETPQSKVKNSKVKNSKKDDVKRTSSNGERVKEVFSHLDKERGYRPPKRKAEATAIIRMLKIYTPDQIINTWEILKHEKFWQDKELHMMTVESQIGAVLKNAAHQGNHNPNGKPAGSSKEDANDPDKFIKGKWGYLTKR